MSDAEEADSSSLIKKSVKQMISNDEVISSTDFGSGHSKSESTNSSLQVTNNTY